MGFLETWELSYDDINEVTTDNPSLQSFIIGYAAEVKCRKLYFDNQRDIRGVYKPDDHNRMEKGDWVLNYKGHPLSVEVKSLQGASLRPRRNGQIIPTFQCDASDSRTVTFKDGSSVQTTSLLVGEFDVLAVNLRALTGQWDFVFCKNEDLPRVDGTRGRAKFYTQYQLDNLIRSSMPLHLTRDHRAIAPWRDEPYSLFDEIVYERRHGTAPTLEARRIDDAGHGHDSGESVDAFDDPEAQLSRLVP